MVNFYESLQSDSFDGSSVCRVSVLNKQNFILIESSLPTAFICMLQISVCLLVILGKCKKKKKMQAVGHFLQETTFIALKKKKYIGNSIDNQNILGNEQQKKEM